MNFSVFLTAEIHCHEVTVVKKKNTNLQSKEVGVIFQAFNSNYFTGTPTEDCSTDWNKSIEELHCSSEEIC